MNCALLPTAVVALFAACVLSPQASAQSTDVKAPNKNRSAKFKSAIFKGSGNIIESNSIASFVGGGQSNKVALGVTNGVIGGGFCNIVSNHLATVAGGWSNAASGMVSTVGGGYGSKASGSYATVGGGNRNTASGAAPTIAGGVLNAAEGMYPTVAGGTGNKATNNHAAVGGGNNNTAGGDTATVAGGESNDASGNYTVIGGGVNNTADGTIATVAGGQQNVSRGYTSTVGGGEYNMASGDYATVPGGNSAMATNNGAFVWNGADGAVTASTNENSFTVRAPGGVRFISTLVDSTTIAPVAGGNDGVFLAPNSGAWASLSDSNAKTKVMPIDPREILSKVAAMPVTQWEYKHDPQRRYIGPMAQDFHAAFGLGRDEKSITTLDSDGVMFAAIQGLVEELKERDKEIAELKIKGGEVDLLKRKLRMVEERLGLLPPAP